MLGVEINFLFSKNNLKLRFCKFSKTIYLIIKSKKLHFGYMNYNLIKYYLIIINRFLKIISKSW